MKKKHNYHDRRHPRTYQEKKANQDQEYVRGKRLPKQLVSLWDAPLAEHQKTWKVKRQTQYRPNRRGKEHSIELRLQFPYGLKYRLSEYFDEHDIPYRIERLFEIELVTRYYKQEYRLVGHIPRLLRTGNPPKSFRDLVAMRQRKLVWIPIYKWVNVKLDKPYQQKYSRFVGLKVTWWSDKDIGIDFILKKIGANEFA